MRKVTVAASLVADLAGYLRARDIDAQVVLRRAGVTPQALSGGDTRVSGAAMAALWREAMAATGDPDIGLHTGASFLPGALDIVGYVMLTSLTANDALRRGARLIRLLNDGLALDVERGAASTTCRVRIADIPGSFLVADARHSIETLLMGTVYQLQLLTERPFLPLSVSMRHAAPDSGVAEHLRLFGIAPRFSAPHDELVLHNRDLDLPLRSANPQLLSAFEAHAESVLGALDAGETIAGRTLREIMVQLKGEVPTIQQVSRALAMSPRNLQRSLPSEGTTFQTLLDGARRELAVRHLSAPDATVAKVAWLVGFSEPSAFHRAFRRWTGHSPGAVRSGAMAPAGQVWYTRESQGR